MASTGRNTDSKYEYTHGYAPSVLRSHSVRNLGNSCAYLLPHLDSNQLLLDVGAGAGTLTVEFAERVSHVTALEVSAEALSLSKGLAKRRGVTNIDFVVQDVHTLDFPDGSFDVVHAHQVLQHLQNPVAAIREMCRVTRPGGIVAIRDSDYGAFAWWPELPELDEWLHLYQQAARSNGGEPNAGRRLVAWARAAGQRNIEASSSTWCYSSPAERELWGGSWAERITDSAIAQQLLQSGLASQAGLETVSEGWLQWVREPDGWFSLLHGEIICHVEEPAAD